MVDEGLCVKLVALESQPGNRGRASDGTVVPHAHANDLPLPVGHVPAHDTGRVEAVGNIHNPARGDRRNRFPLGRLRPRLGQDSRHVSNRRVGRPVIQRLLVDVLQGRGVGIARESKHHHIFVVVLPPLLQFRREYPLAEVGVTRAGHRQLHRLHASVTLDLRDASHQVPHRLRALDPRAAAAGPPRAHAQTHLYAQPLTLFHGVDKGLLPFGREIVEMPAREPQVHLEKQHRPDAHPAHRFEVFGHLFFRKTPVHEIPVDPGTGRVGRVFEMGFQILHRVCRAGKQVSGQKQKAANAFYRAVHGNDI